MAICGFTWELVKNTGPERFLGPTESAPPGWGEGLGSAARVSQAAGTEIIELQGTCLYDTELCCCVPSGTLLCHVDTLLKYSCLTFLIDRLQRGLTLLCPSQPWA